MKWRITNNQPRLRLISYPLFWALGGKKKKKKKSNYGRKGETDGFPSTSTLHCNMEKSL